MAPRLIVREDHVATVFPKKGSHRLQAHLGEQFRLTAREADAEHAAGRAAVELLLHVASQLVDLGG